MSDYKPDIHKELYEVSGAGKCDRVRELLEAGANPDKYKDGAGDTALHDAVSYQQEDYRKENFKI